MNAAPPSDSKRISEDQFVHLCRGIRIRLPEDSQGIGWIVSESGNRAGVVLDYPHEGFWGALVVDLSADRCHAIQVSRALRSVATAEREIQEAFAESHTPSVARSSHQPSYA